ncbi:hypothetical protein ASPTUDRAFT_41759 [Aspergillus tubingensis CBS 134.48]|uniref:Uncharacterized protein n=1 Tax=Aspergillus tubingensis (strain CBS 134.48) TaxID=767770 RepID=A0A1L9N8E4_ASPTC|nr:hypothetical protein ASPTUDRAFT_41759 [Aspergillus tubingensis CBS 134.48]
MIPTHSTLRRRSAVRSRKASVIRRNFKVVTTSGMIRRSHSPFWLLRLPVSLIFQV